MKVQILKYQFGVLVVSAMLLGLGPLNSLVNAQGRHGGGGSSSSSSSSSSSRSSAGGSSRSSSSGSSSRSSGSSNRSNRDSSSGGSRNARSGGSSSSSSSTSSSSGSGRTWGHRHDNQDKTARAPKRDQGTGKRNASGGDSSIGSTSGRSNAERGRAADNGRALTVGPGSDRNRVDDPEGGRRHRHGDDNGRKFPGGSRYRSGDRREWHRHECERGRYYYPTTVYVPSNYDNYGYGLSAYDRGYEDGLFTGASDAWRGQSYDPERSHFYKHGAGGFLSIFGGPGWYKAAYRDGFLRGYEEGYQHYETYFVDGRFRR